VTANGMFLVDIDKRIRAAFKYSPSTGRNLYEILRLYDALHLVTHHRVVCPVNWAHGQEVVLHPSVRADEAAQFRYAEIKPWFRLTSAPE
jgi:alkyl hydroperoxide reductase subunit AhpC